MEYGELIFSLREEPKTVVLRLQISSIEVSENLYWICNKGFNTQANDAQSGQPYNDSEPIESKPAEATSPYDILGVKLNATDEEIRQAFRTLTKKYHPDRVAHLGPEFGELAEARMKEINQAYAAVLREAIK